MCGITGFVNFQGHNPEKAQELVLRMTKTLVHRGPDEEGMYVDNFAALGHRRLSIIDIASGQQPMDIGDGSFHIVHNGEIYNFLDLMKELEGYGHNFRTESDTEVILRAYAQWSTDCVSRLNGMFSFAIWDRRNRALFLARDRAGKKPLYYYFDGQTFAFGSELKAILAGGFSQKEINSQALDCFYSFGYIPCPMTIFTDVKKLEPANNLEVREEGLKKRRYWSVSFAVVEQVGLQDATDELEYLLDDAVSCRLMSEVPLGAFLSGGLDSTLIVSYMARNLDRPVLTNSIGFVDKKYNELPVASSVAKHLSTDHREFVVEPKAAEILETLAWHFDEPFADSSAVPTWYVCQMAKKNVTVALSGDGGDETFGGYTYRYLPHILESRIRHHVPRLFRRPFFSILGAVYPRSSSLPRFLRLKTIFENLAVTDAEAFYRDLVWLQQEAKKQLYSGDFMTSLRGFTPFEIVASRYGVCHSQDPLARCQNVDLNFYMPEDVLVKVDRMGMAHSLEVRSPLLDYRVIEFAAKLPARLKVNKCQGKILLRHLAGRHLPVSVLNQPKRGFDIPAAEWLRGELEPMAREVIFGKSFVIRDTLESKALGKLWQEHQSGNRDHSGFLWGLLMLGLWERHYY